MIRDQIAANAFGTVMAKSAKPKVTKVEQKSATLRPKVKKGEPIGATLKPKAMKVCTPRKEKQVNLDYGIVLRTNSAERLMRAPCCN